MIVMMDKLRRNKLDGFVLDQFTYWQFQASASTFMQSNLSFLNDNLISSDDAVKSIEFFMKDTMKTTFHYKGAEQLTYGMLVRHRIDYDFLVNMMKEQRMRVRAMMEIGWNYYKTDKE